MSNTIFFRNDDVRDQLDDSLIDITNIFINKNIPITHAVEPANITKNVADWLNNIKNKFPDYVDIMQHGYDHTIKNKFKKGEFGGQRGYKEQFIDIKNGKDLMNKWFGESWFPAFNFPYAPYNPAAIQAVDDLNYKVINSHYNQDLSRKIFYFIGHRLNKGYLFNHHVSWNYDYYPGTNLFEIDMNISLIKNYINEGTDAEFYTIDELIKQTLRYKDNYAIGVLLHHRYHNSNEKIRLIEKYIDWCVEKRYRFISLPNIYKNLSEQKINS